MVTKWEEVLYLGNVLSWKPYTADYVYFHSLIGETKVGNANKSSTRISLVFANCVECPWLFPVEWSVHFFSKPFLYSYTCTFSYGPNPFHQNLFDPIKKCASFHPSLSPVLEILIYENSFDPNPKSQISWTIWGYTKFWILVSYMIHRWNLVLLTILLA